MSDKFHSLMSAIDDDLLEEAMEPVRKTNHIPWVGAAIAACLVLAIGLTMFPNRAPSVTAAQLAEMGYEIRLPKDAEKVRYEVVTLSEQEGAQASFEIADTKYVYKTVKSENRKHLSDNGKTDTQVLSWTSGDLSIQLLSSAKETSVSWYLENEQTQCYLTANANSLKVLTTASQILRSTGLNVTVAPENAENITYNAFRLDGLTVAETTFRINGITYAYRMAGTTELLDDFKDISGVDGPFDQIAAGEVFWCRAKINFNEGQQGKIIWFDVVPGILYSLSMDKDASEEALVDIANAIFVPAQEDN